MKYFASLVVGTLLMVLASWSLWSSASTAQNVASPSIADPLKPAVPAGLVAEGPPMKSGQPETGLPGSTSAPAPIGLPGPPRQLKAYAELTPEPSRSTFDPIVGLVSRDDKTLELVKAYQAIQSTVDQLLKRHHDAQTDTEKDALREQIAEQTAAQFDLRQQVREREIEQLKQRLANVEASVASRSELKDQIVEKRVADILKEPDQLNWEPRGMASPSVFAPANIQPTPSIPGAVPRTVVRYEETPIVDADGNTKIVRRPIYETVYVVPIPEHGYAGGSSAKAQAPVYGQQPDSVPQPHDAAQDPFEAAAPTVNDIQLMLPSHMTVVEAEARVHIAQRKLFLLTESHKAGQTTLQDVQAAEGELELAKLNLSRARTEYAGRKKLLELEIQQAQAALAQAEAELAEANEVNKRSPHAIPTTRLSALQAAVGKARYALERTMAMLELHEKTNQVKSEAADEAQDNAVTPLNGY